MTANCIRNVLLCAFREEARDHKLLSDVFAAWSSRIVPMTDGFVETRGFFEGELAEVD